MKQGFEKRFKNGDIVYWCHSEGNGRYTVKYGMQGTPYIYQGEELGMTNVRYPISEYRDIEILNMYQERKALGYPKSEIMESIYAKGRDNARTPMQWDQSANAGFSMGRPWIQVNPNYMEINANEELNDPESARSH